MYSRSDFSNSPYRKSTTGTSQARVAGSQKQGGQLVSTDSGSCRSMDVSAAMDITVAMQYLRSSGLIDSASILPLYEGLQPLVTLPSSMSFDSTPTVQYPVNLAFQFIAELALPQKRELVGDAWHRYLADCLTLVVRSEDAQRYPALLHEAVKAADDIIMAVNGSTSGQAWAYFDESRPVGGGSNLNTTPYEVIRVSCWPGSVVSPSPATAFNGNDPAPVLPDPQRNSKRPKFGHPLERATVFPLGKERPLPVATSSLKEVLSALERSSLFKSKPQRVVADPLVPFRRLEASLWPEDFPEMPHQCSYALSVVIDIVARVERRLADDGGDGDKIDALLREEPACREVLARCQALLPCLTELSDEQREGLAREIQGLQNLIHYHEAKGRTLSV